MFYLLLDYGYTPVPDLAQALSQGGYIIFLRHATTDRKQTDRDRDLSKCEGQRNLNPPLVLG